MFDKSRNKNDRADEPRGLKYHGSPLRGATIREANFDVAQAVNRKLKPAAHDACFPAGLLAFSKLLEILPSVRCVADLTLERYDPNLF